MGYRKVPTIYTIDDFEKYPGLEVRMKGLKLGKLKKFITMDDDDLDSSVEEIVKLLAEGIVSWNLEDEDGQPVPTTPEAFDDQELEFLMDLFGAWSDRILGVSKELGKDSTSGVSSPAPPLMMEAL